MYRLIHGDGLKFLASYTKLVDTIFADPPDNIGLGYDWFKDCQPEDQYAAFLYEMLELSMQRAATAYFSVNARWMILLSSLAEQLLCEWRDAMEARWLIQSFTFGQHNHTDLANNFRPILRIRWNDAPLLTENCRVESWRMRNGDKRANPNGRVPGDVWLTDFLEYARVTGNSKQRRVWHPTQLHEGLVEDLIRLSTPPGGTVIDPFAGTGTTLRVCQHFGWPCTTCELSSNYCAKISEETGIPVEELDELVLQTE